MFSVICVWTNDRVNNRDAGDLRRHRAHYDVTGMKSHHFTELLRQENAFEEVSCKMAAILFQLPCVSLCKLWLTSWEMASDNVLWTVARQVNQRPAQRPQGWPMRFHCTKLQLSLIKCVAPLETVSAVPFDAIWWHETWMFTADINHLNLTFHSRRVCFPSFWRTFLRVLCEAVFSRRRLHCNCPHLVGVGVVSKYTHILQSWLKVWKFET